MPGGGWPSARGIAVWALGISLAAEVIGGDAQAEIFQYIDSMRDVAIVWLMVWFALRFIRLIEEHYIATHSEERLVDQTTASAVGKLLRDGCDHRYIVGASGFGVSVSGFWPWRYWGYCHRFCGQRFIGQFLWRSDDFLDRPFQWGIGCARLIVTLKAPLKTLVGVDPYPHLRQATCTCRIRFF